MLFPQRAPALSQVFPIMPTHWLTVLQADCDQQRKHRGLASLQAVFESSRRTCSDLSEDLDVEDLWTLIVQLRYLPSVAVRVASV